MSGSSSKRPKTAHRKGEGNGRLEITRLISLLDQQDEPMRQLFAKALNLYVSPGSEALSDREKLDRLKKALEESLPPA